LNLKNSTPIWVISDKQSLLLPLFLFKSMSDDSKYLKLLQAGSAPAFEYLYNQYSGKLYNFISKINHGDGYQAEEIVQRTFINIWEKREQIDPEKSFLSYICTIAKNMLLNELEHQTVEFIYQEYVKQEKSTIEYFPDKETDLKILEGMIDNFAKQLPPKQKQIFLLSKRQEYSVKEIAGKLNLAETTVRTQLAKALMFMQKQIAKYYHLIGLLLGLIYNKS
jgi:RNA polymerase sigma-70 factor (ECF subfamily)